MEKYDVIVIGAGPAGLMSALSIKNKRVLVIEKNNVSGKKLLISGAGQCNYTNSCEMQDLLKKYGDKGRFLKPALYSFTNQDTIEFFKKLGVESTIREDNKVFPSSFKSADILNALLRGCSANGVEIIYNKDVDSVNYNKECKLFTLKYREKLYACDFLIIATGGKSYSVTGSNGDGYAFAQKLGHTINQPRQSLTPIYVEDYEFKDLSGISFQNIKVSLWRNNRKINEFEGDLLLTHTNLSGPVIINNSRYIEEGDILKFNFTQYKNSEIFREYFEETVSSNGRLTVKTVLRELNLPKRFVDKIFGMLASEDNLMCSQISKETRKKLIQLISDYPMKVVGLGNFNISMATKGGISTDEINSKTMESKLTNCLFFCGEIIDIDGDTGGYNIQAAFSTGYLAANTINRY